MKNLWETPVQPLLKMFSFSNKIEDRCLFCDCKNTLLYIQHLEFVKHYLQSWWWPQSWSDSWEPRRSFLNSGPVHCPDTDASNSPKSAKHRPRWTPEAQPAAHGSGHLQNKHKTTFYSKQELGRVVFVKWLYDIGKKTPKNTHSINLGWNHSYISKKSS